MNNYMNITTWIRDALDCDAGDRQEIAETVRAARRGETTLAWCEQCAVPGTASDTMEQEWWLIGPDGLCGDCRREE